MEAQSDIRIIFNFLYQKHRVIIQVVIFDFICQEPKVLNYAWYIIYIVWIQQHLDLYNNFRKNNHQKHNFNNNFCNNHNWENILPS